MDKSQKLYIKALNKYNDGYIDKAINLCEKSISLNIRNAASINLKGLLKYLKGDINTARKLWKMNCKVNNDGVSKKYIENSGSDAESLDFYKRAVVLMKALKINEALMLLEKCSNSDFNLINVGNRIAECYIKKGEYEKAGASIEKVLKVDTRNSKAISMKKNLQSMNILKKPGKGKKIILLCACVGIVAILSGIFLVFYKNTDSRKTGHVVSDKTASVSAAKSKDKKKDKIINKSDNYFSSSLMKAYIENKNYDKLFSEMEKVKSPDKLAVNDKVIWTKAKDFMSSEGAVYFYQRGCNYMSSKEYNSAKDSFQKGFKYGELSSVYPDITYMLGYDLDLSDDKENAIKYYEKYDQSYSSGDYEETVLYRLALIYKDINASKAKSYAVKLADRYPQSIYNNSTIKYLIQN
jgi:tetratricopeptide (TPR) repeat protein